MNTKNTKLTPYQRNLGAAYEQGYREGYSVGYLDGVFSDLKRQTLWTKVKAVLLHRVW